MEIAADCEQFVSAARQLMRRPRDAWLADVDRFLADMSWDHTWSAMEGLVVDVLDADEPAPQRPGVRALTPARGDKTIAAADLSPGDRHP